MNTRLASVFGLLLFVFLVLSSCLFTVKQTERAVRLLVGRIVDTDLKPGLYLKFPFIYEVRKFDGRMMLLDMNAAEYLTQEKKRLVVDSFVTWKVANVERYYTSTGGGDPAAANTLLAPRVNEGLRNQFGERTVHEVVSGEREKLAQEITQEITDLAKKELGIEVVDIRIKRIELPPNVSDSVYDRMRAERKREAREHRSKGNETAEGIRADADRQRRIILAEAYREAENTRGEGDALAAQTYASAYSQDSEFFRFYRSLNAYRNSFDTKNNLLVLSPEGDFFDYFNSNKAKH